MTGILEMSLSTKLGHSHQASQTRCFTGKSTVFCMSKWNSNHDGWAMFLKLFLMFRFVCPQRSILFKYFDAGDVARPHAAAA